MATLNKYTTYSYTFANPNTSGDTILIPAVGNNNWIYTPVVISSLNRMLMGVGR